MTTPVTSAAALPASVETPAGLVDTLIDGGEMDCGSCLLLLITRSMRRLQPGQSLGVRSTQYSVVDDLPVWAELVGHLIIADQREGDEGPWWFVVQKANASVSTVFTQGDRTPVGERLWVYTNFDCNLQCSYCVAESSPRAERRGLAMPVYRRLLDEAAETGVQEIFLTGGEPFLLPDIAERLNLAVVGPIVFRGSLVDVLQGSARDLTTHGLAGTMRRVGFQSHDARIFEVLTDRGGVLVGIRGEPRAADALAIMHSYGGGNAAIGAWTGRV